MAKDPKLDMSAFADQTKEQAMSAVDEYFGFLQKTLSAFPSAGNPFGDSLKANTEKNLAAMHDFFRRLGQAKDFQDVMRIQTEFAQSQFAAISEQTRSLGETVAKAAPNPLVNTGKKP